DVGRLFQTRHILRGATGGREDRDAIVAGIGHGDPPVRRHRDAARAEEPLLRGHALHGAARAIYPQQRAGPGVEHEQAAMAGRGARAGSASAARSAGQGLSASVGTTERESPGGCQYNVMWEKLSWSRKRTRMSCQPWVSSTGPSTYWLRRGLSTICLPSI